MLSDAVLEELDDAVEAGVDFLASVVLFLGVSSDPYAPGNLVPPFNGNLDVGVDLELDSPPFSLLEMKMFAQTETSLSSVFPARIKNLIVAINTVAFKPPVSFCCQEGGYTNALLR